MTLCVVLVRLQAEVGCWWVWRCQHAARSIGPYLETRYCAVQQVSVWFHYTTSKFDCVWYVISETRLLHLVVSLKWKWVIHLQRRKICLLLNLGNSKHGAYAVPYSLRYCQLICNSYIYLNLRKYWISQVIKIKVNNEEDHYLHTHTHPPQQTTPRLTFLLF